MLTFSRNSFIRCCIQVAAIAGLCGLSTVSTALAQTNYFWNAQSPTANPANGGSGTWNESGGLVWLSPTATTIPAVAWSDNNNANFGGSAGNVTVGATVSAAGLYFGTTGYTLTGNTIDLTGSTPTIQVGAVNGGTGSTVSTFVTTISSNISAASPLSITDAGGGTGAVNNVLFLTGTTTIGSGNLTLTSNSNSGELFTTAIASSLSLSTLTLQSTNNTANAIYLSSGATVSNGAASNWTNGTLTTTGATPTINFGSGPNGQGKVVGWMYENISSTNALNVVATNVAPFQTVSGGTVNSIGSPPAINFEGTSSSFAGGINLTSTVPASGAGAFDSTNGQDGVARFNFDQPNAAGTGAGAGTINVVANGVILTDTGGAAATTINIQNNIHLNSNNITPVNQASGGQFITAMGATKAASGLTQINYSGQISGAGAVLIGNALTRASGGAGKTIFSNTMSYTGKTIFNGTFNTSTHAIADLEMGTTNALPSTNVFQFGYSDNEATNGGLLAAGGTTGALQTKTLGNLDLNGYSQTIASLVSSIATGTSINGITNSNATPSGGQVAIPTLTIDGSTNDWYTGGIGSALNSGAIYPTLLNGFNTVALTRSGSGSTTLGSSSFTGAPGVTGGGAYKSSGTTIGNRSDYVGDTNIENTAALIAASTDAFSPNSNFILSNTATLDLNGYNNTVNSLQGPAGTTVTNNINGSSTSARPLNYNGETGFTTTTNQAAALGSDNAVLTFGKVGSLNASPAPTETFSGVLADGTAGKLGIAMGGPGTQILAGTNTYTGPTSANSGVLSIAGAGSIAAGSAVGVNSGGTLTGTGTIKGSVTLNSGGNLTPGSTTTPGTLNIGSSGAAGGLSLVGGGIYTWKINNVSGAGTGFDQINLASNTTNGTLTLTGATSTSPAVLKLNSLGSAPAGWGAGTTSQSWQIATFAGETGGTPSATPLSNFVVNSTNFQGVPNAFSGFNVTNPSTGVLQLNYNFVVAPSNQNWTIGAGTWTSANFNGGTGNYNSAEGADFTSGSGTVTVGSAITSPIITFDTTGYTLSGTGSTPITASNGFNALIVQVSSSSITGTISAPINSPLTVVGGASTAGTLNVTVNGNVGGRVIVSAATLVGNVDSLGGNGTGTSTAGMTNNGSVTLDQTTESSVTSAAYNGVMDGGGSLTIKGNSNQTVTLGGVNTYTGGTTLTGGTVAISAANNIGDPNGTLAFNGGTLSTAVGRITYTNPVTISSSGGTLTDGNTSSSLNAFAGGGTIANGATFTKNGAGVFQILNAGWTGSSGTFVINGGTLLLGDETSSSTNPSTFVGTNAVTLAKGTTLTIAAPSDTNASITPSALNLNPGTGTVTLALYKTGGTNPLNPSLPLGSTTTITSGAAGGTVKVTTSLDNFNQLTGPSVLSLGITNITGGPTTFVTDANFSEFTSLVFNGVVHDGGNTLTFLGGSDPGNNGNASPQVPTSSSTGGIAFGATASSVTMTGQWIIGSAPTGAANKQTVNAETLSVNPQLSATPQFGMTTGNITVHYGSQLFIAPRQATFGPASPGTQTITLNGPGPVDSNGKYQGAISVVSDNEDQFNAQVTTVLGTEVESATNGTTGVALPNQVWIDLPSSSVSQPSQLTFNGPVTGSGNLVYHGRDSTSTLFFSGANTALTGSTTIAGGYMQVSAGSSLPTGMLTMAQLAQNDNSEPAGQIDTALTLNNATQTIGGLSSLYPTPPADASNPVIQDITLNGTALTIIQSTKADYGINYTLDTPFPIGIVAGTTSKIDGTGSVTLGATSTAELSLTGDNSYSGGTIINGNTTAASLAIYSDTSGSHNLGSATGRLTLNGGQLHAIAPPNGGTAAPFSLDPSRPVTIGANGAILTDAGVNLSIPGQTTWNASSNLTVESNSYVKFASTANAASVGAGSTATVSSGATLELNGSASALSDGTHYVNVANSSTASVGGLLVSSPSADTQLVGAVTGTGSTVVDAGSNLSAASIVQSSLIIGGTSVSSGLVTIRDATANGAVVTDTSADDPAGTTSAAPASLISSTSSALASSLNAGSLDAPSLGGGGNLDLFGGSSSLSGAGGSLASVPEPSTFVLSGLAVLVLVCIAVRRRSAVARRAGPCVS